MTEEHDSEPLAQARSAIRDDDDRQVAAAAHRVEQRLSAWVRAEAADRARGQDRSAPIRIRPQPSAWRHWAARGIGLAAILTIAVVLWRHTLARSTPQAADVRTYATTIGQQAVVTLNDGTSITLAPQSKLRIAQFGTHGRAVELEGEAYFDVAHVDGAPFVVRTGAVETRVLGTTFFVRRYVNDATARVSVVTGKVAVGTRGRHAVTVVAGGDAEATDSTIVAKNDSGVTRETGWLDGQLVFHDAPTPDVLQALHRWYGYDFRFADSTLAHRSLTVVISTRSSTDALGTLKTYLNVDLRFDGSIVTLVPRHGSRSMPQPSRTLPITHTSPTEVGR